jgi:uncharacterized Zn finger protein (UPF0148 family)
MFCNKCGTKLEEGSLFCPMCGNKVTIDTSKEGASKVDETANNEEIELKKVEPKQIKTVTEEEKKQNAEEVKGMFFKKVEASQELIDELKEAEEQDRINNANEQAPSEVKDEKHKGSILTNIIGKSADKDLDKPVYKSKIVIFGVILLLLLFIATIVTISMVRINTKTRYSADVSDSSEYNKIEIKEISNKKNGWVEDYYYKNDKKVKNEWAEYKRSDGLIDWYYLDKNGEIVKSDWIEDPPNSNKWYYVDSNGAMIKGKYEYVGSDVYYFQSNGQLLINSTTPDGEHFVGADGKVIN